MPDAPNPNPVAQGGLAAAFSGRRPLPAPTGPTPAGPLRIRAAQSPLLAGAKGAVWVELEVSAPEAADAPTREPLDLMLVVDCSSSMSGAPIERVIEAGRWAVGRLGPQDRVAIVRYDNQAQLVLALTDDHSLALSHLGALRAGGMTALAAGLWEGVEALGAASAGRSRKLFLLSDGQANVGETDPARIAAGVAGAASSGIRFSTFGLGEHYDENLLEAIAEAGLGGYHYIPDPDAIPAALATELEGALTTTLYDGELAVTAATGATITTSLGSELVAGVVRIGDLAAGASRRVLVEIAHPSAADGAPVELLEASLRYRAAGATGTRIQAAACAVPASADEAAVSAGVCPEVLERVVALEAAEAQRKAAAAADRGDFAAAQALFQDTDQRLAALAGNFADAPSIALAVGQHRSRLAADSRITTAGVYDGTSAKELKMRSYATRTSRG